MFAKLSDVAYVAQEPLRGEVRAVVLIFHGLNAVSVMNRTPIEELELAAGGALCVYPYFGPWSWMNGRSRTLVDAIVERVYAEYGLSDSIPLILRGGSMGGHAALTYALYAKRVPAAVECNCPVTDPRFHATERPDLPRTFLHAYGLDGRDIEAVFAENSPVEQVAKMPRVPYLIIHGTADLAVNKQAHSDVFVAKLRQAGHEVEYVQVPEMGHCAFNDYAAFRRYQDFVLDAMRNR